MVSVSRLHIKALSLMEERMHNELSSGHFPTLLKGLDDALCGGIPFGSLTELVGPAGIGKTQVRSILFHPLLQTIIDLLSLSIPCSFVLSCPVWRPCRLASVAWMVV